MTLPQHLSYLGGKKNRSTFYATLGDFVCLFAFLMFYNVSKNVMKPCKVPSSFSEMDPKFLIQNWWNGINQRNHFFFGIIHLARTQHFPKNLHFLPPDKHMYIGNCSFSENFVYVQINDPFEIYWTGNKRIIGEFVLLRFTVSSLLRFSDTIS